ncbi:DUF262 and DUF1524 domain-containing protein [Lactovum odontotermitis]
MKTDNQSIDYVLTQNNTSFFIPPFQRAYAWGKNEIDRYFEDLVRIIESELDEEQNDKLEHFFGTVVIKTEKERFSTKSIIVDGQQRLTTTLIFLIALRDAIADEEYKNLIDGNYLKNNSSSFEDKIKLKQVTRDWVSYRNLVNGEDTSPGIIRTAYELFYKKIVSQHFTIDNYLTALSRINVALIFLDERPFKGEDPQIIFETLNSLGKPLSLADLVRNYVLLEMVSSEQSNIYESIWHPKIEKLFEEGTSKFFRDYLQYKLGTSLKVVSDNNTKELYQSFKDFVGSKFPKRVDFVNDIVRFAPWYNLLITEDDQNRISNELANDAKIHELLRNIFFDIKTDPFKPLVLGLLEYHQDFKTLSDNQLIETLETIRTYLIRRRTLGLTTAENKNIPMLSRRITDIAAGKTTMMELLCSQQYALRMPNNTEIRERLKDINFYEGLKSYSKFILGQIEAHTAKVAVNFRDKKITIEHIMPQKLRSQWKDELGEDYKDVQEKYLHNIGNLILTEFNSEMGNEPFAAKKAKYETSSLHYRLDVIDKEVWNEEAILAHQNKMITWYLETFPLPESKARASNWNQDTPDISVFSPMEDGLEDWLKGTKPKKIMIDAEEYDVKTWQDVFLTFMKWISDSKDYSVEYVFANQERLFGREDVLMEFSKLRHSVASSEGDKLTRYKSLDGTVAAKLRDDFSGYVFHINANTNTLVGRLSSVMKEYNLDDDFIIIEIQ